METPSVGNPLLWISFIAFIVAMIVLDFAVFNRRARKASIRAAAGWVVFWVSLAAAFAVGVFVKFGSERGLEFVTAYQIGRAHV